MSMLLNPETKAFIPSVQPKNHGKTKKVSLQLKSYNWKPKDSSNVVQNGQDNKNLPKLSPRKTRRFLGKELYNLLNNTDKNTNKQKQTRRQRRQRRGRRQRH